MMSVWTTEAATTFNSLQQAAVQAKTKRESTGKKKTSKLSGLFKQVVKCIALLLENPRHQGLQIHAYDSIENPYNPLATIFEAYLQKRSL